MKLYQLTPIAKAVRQSVSIGLVTVMSSGAYAQLEEVVVTAQHRAENVQDIPISVSALGADSLKKADIFDAGSIAQNVPGMAYAEFSPGQANISMRGVSSVDDGAGLDNSTALFLDGVYIGRGASINFDMFDLDRIEVLRGPQGTLFGRNAIGGAINVVSAKPTDELSIKAGATVGNEGILRYQGYLSGPFSDALKGKITLSHREHDGYVRNLILNKDQQDEDQTSVRAQLLLSLDSSEWLLSVDSMEDEREDMGRTPVVNGNFDYLSVLAKLGAGARESAAPIDGFSNREASGFSLQGDIEFTSGVLTTITAFRQAETDWEMASIGAPAGGGSDFLDDDPTTNDVFGVDVNDDIVEDIDTFSQEIRWTSTLDGNFNYTAGFYYFTEETDRIEQFKLDRNSISAGQVTLGNEYAGTFNETTSYAVYGQGTWELSEQWSVTVGARYTVDEKDYTAVSVNCDLVRDGDPSVLGTQFENFTACAGIGGSLNIIAEAFEASTNEDWDDFSPKFAMQYRPQDNLMFFASVSKGFKSGGFGGSQGVQAAATQPVDPETAINWEFGVKTDVLDDSLRINATTFYTDYEDLQVVRFGPVAGTAFGAFQTTNIGSADITGVEVEVTWFLWDGFNIEANYAYLDTEVNDLILDTAGGQIDASGSDLRQAPQNSYSVAFNYNVETSVGFVDFNLSFSHADEQLNDYINQNTTIDAYDLVGSRLSWTSPNEEWEVALWGKNLTDKDYFSHTYVIGPGVIGSWAAPRTYGLSVNWNL
jgi:iron complex outermembrane recepter protein